MEWAIKRHMIEAYPNEGCGLIVNDAFVGCSNVATRPDRDFEISPDFIRDLFDSGAEIQAVLHSHVNGKEFPTSIDMRNQIEAAMPWGVVTVGENGSTGPIVWWGEQLPVQPYEMRKFRWNVHDCFELVRDWYRKEHAIPILGVPREDEWWEDKIDAETGEIYWRGRNLFVEVMPALGFTELPRESMTIEKLEIGDVLASPLATPCESHCAVYVGNNLILHHPARALSVMEPIAYRAWEHTTRIYRRTDWL